MNQKIKTLQIIHLALCAGAAVAYLVNREFSVERLMLSNVDSATFPFLIIPIVAVIASKFLFRLQLKQANPNDEPEENFGIYQTASLIRWAVLDGAAFLLLYVAPELMILGFVVIGYMLYLRPTEDRVVADLKSFAG